MLHEKGYNRNLQLISLKIIMEVRIIKSGRPTYWYSSLIDNVYLVKEECGNYTILNNDDPHNGIRAGYAYIDKEDCVIKDTFLPTKFIRKCCIK